MHRMQRIDKTTNAKYLKKLLSVIDSLAWLRKYGLLVDGAAFRSICFVSLSVLHLLISDCCFLPSSCCGFIAAERIASGYLNANKYKWLGVCCSVKTHRWWPHSTVVWHRFHCPFAKRNKEWNGPENIFHIWLTL